MRIEITAASGAQVSIDCSEHGFSPDIIDNMKNRAVEAFAALMSLDTTIEVEDE